MPSPRFIVFLRAPSFARVLPGSSVVTANVPTESGPVTCTFTTNFVNEGFESEVPRGLNALVESVAPDIDSATTAALNAALMLKVFRSLSANASVTPAATSTLLSGDRMKAKKTT